MQFVGMNKVSFHTVLVGYIRVILYTYVVGTFWYNITRSSLNQILRQKLFFSVSDNLL